MLGRGGAGARGEAREGGEGMSARSGRESGRRARSRREHRSRSWKAGDVIIRREPSERETKLVGATTTTTRRMPAAEATGEASQG